MQEFENNENDNNNQQSNGESVKELVLALPTWLNVEIPFSLRKNFTCFSHYTLRVNEARAARRVIDVDILP